MGAVIRFAGLRPCRLLVDQRRCVHVPALDQWVVELFVRIFVRKLAMCYMKILSHV
jgi:hypothetical protein